MTNKCKTCMHGYPSVECVNCGTGFRNYLPYTPPTNADRIRGMTDEELAEFLSHHVCYSGMADKVFTLRWLRQPTEEEV